MSAKQIVGIIALILMVPILISLLVFSFNIGKGDVQQNTEKATDLMIEAVTPWWLGLIKTLSGWGIFGAIILIIFFMILKKYPKLS